MGSPYLRKNEPQDAALIPLFHAWGDLLLSRHMASESLDPWVEGLATRWTIQTACSCFELACHLALGRNPSDPSQKLSPRFWKNLNRVLSQRNPPIAGIDLKQPPWDDWHLIQEERHPFAHLGAGGGRFPRRADAQLAVEESEKAIKRFFAIIGVPHPRWLSASVSWPQDASPLRTAFGAQGGVVFTPTLTIANASRSDPTTVRMAIIGLDGKESCDFYPAEYDWKPRFESLLNNLASPIKGIRVYDANQVYLDEPLLMWGGEG
jgi:hypothetical protein